MNSNAESMDHIFLEVAQLLTRCGSDLEDAKMGCRSMRTVDLDELKRIVALCKVPLPPEEGTEDRRDLLRQHADSGEGWMFEHMDTISQFACLPASSVEAKVMKRLAQHWIAHVARGLLRDWKWMVEQEWLRRDESPACHDDLFAAPVAVTRRHRWFAAAKSWCI